MKLANIMGKAWKIVPVNISWGLNRLINKPFMCVLFITSSCNMRCQMCNEWKLRRKDELSTEEIKKLIDDVSGMGVKIFNISGGEPLIRKDLFEIAEYAKSKGMETKLSTNATLIDDKKAEQVARNFDFVSISIDSCKPGVHDKIRGVPGAYNLAIGGTKRLLEARKKIGSGIKITLAATVSKDNISTAAEVAETMEEIGADHITYTLVNDWKSLEKGKSSIMPSLEETSKFIGKVLSRKKNGMRIRNSTYYLNKCVDYVRKGQIYPVNCKIYYLITYVNANGDIIPCPVCSETVGNIRKDSISNIWKSKRYQEKRNSLKKGCQKCWWTCTAEVNLLYSPTKVWKVAKDAVRYFK